MAWGVAGTSSRPFFSLDLGLQIRFSENVRVCSLPGPLVIWGWWRESTGLHPGQARVAEAWLKWAVLSDSSDTAQTTGWRGSVVTLSDGLTSVC